MMIRRFLSVVPRPVQLWSYVTVGCAVLIGLVAGSRAADPGETWRMMFIYGSAALGVGIVLAIWLLCLGFVFGDARRRSMRSILWVLVAALFPHLLGFLLYFVMRHPIASPCASCGMNIARGQRFCPWCGIAQHSSMAGDVPSPIAPLKGLNL